MFFFQSYLFWAYSTDEAIKKSAATRQVKARNKKVRNELADLEEEEEAEAEEEAGEALKKKGKANAKPQPTKTSTSSSSGAKSKAAPQKKKGTCFEISP